MKQKTKIYRQGDVMLVRVTSVARGKDATENGRAILAHGEATGHAHEVIAESGTVTLEEINDQTTDVPAGARLLRVSGRAVVKHEEHSPIALPRGTYRVIRQREYSPEAIRNVAD